MSTAWERYMSDAEIGRKVRERITEILATLDQAVSSWESGDDDARTEDAVNREASINRKFAEIVKDFGVQS